MNIYQFICNIKWKNNGKIEIAELLNSYCVPSSLTGRRARLKLEIDTNMVREYLFICNEFEFCGTLAKN